MSGLRCDKCRHLSGGRLKLAEHWISTHARSLRHILADYHCDLCPYFAIDKGALAGHCKTQHPLCQPLSQCDDCDYTTPRLGSLALHWLKRHFHRAAYFCDDCSFGSNRKDGLARHRKSLAHSKADSGGESKSRAQSVKKEKPRLELHCDDCPLITHDTFCLSQHWSVKHSSRHVQKLCDDCGREFNQLNNLLRHWASRHSRTGPKRTKIRICDICEKVLTGAPKTMIAHLLVHHNLWPKDCKCDECGVGFSFRWDIAYHFASIHSRGQARIPKFSCDACLKSLCSKQAMQSHWHCAHSGKGTLRRGKRNENRVRQRLVCDNCGISTRRDYFPIYHASCF